LKLKDVVDKRLGSFLDNAQSEHSSRKAGSDAAEAPEESVD